MKKRLFCFLGCLLCGNPLTAVPSPAWAAERPQIAAQAAVLMDGDSGRILWSKNAADPLPMASTTKIMTALLALEEGDLDRVVTISPRAAAAPPVDMGLRAGEEYRLGDLLYPLLLESANDAAIAVAEGVSGSVEDFCERMTERAAELGATDTVFVTPNGLDEGDHHSTAADMARIARRAFQNPDFLALAQTRSRTITTAAGTNPQTFTNKNRLLWEVPGMLGGKTGFTGAAGHCFVGAARQEGRTLITVVLASGWGAAGKAQKWTDTRALLGYGFQNYRPVTLFVAGDAAGSLPVFRSEAQGVPLCLAQGFTCLMTEEEQARVRLRVCVPEAVEAPVNAGQTVGYAEAVLEGQVLARTPVIAGASAQRRGAREYWQWLWRAAGSLPGWE